MVMTKTGTGKLSFFNGNSEPGRPVHVWGSIPATKPKDGERGKIDIDIFDDVATITVKNASGQVCCTAVDKELLHALAGWVIERNQPHEGVING